MGLGFASRAKHATDLVMWTMPAVFALVGGLHQDSRFRRGMGGTLPAEIENKTSALPFAALIEGRQSWRALADDLAEKPLNVGLAAALALVLAL